MNSLTLLEFDPDSGQTKVLNQKGFEGMLAEDACFDQDGDAIAVAIYHDRGQSDGKIEYWRVREDHLERTITRVNTPRGLHALKRAS